MYLWSLLLVLGSSPTFFKEALMLSKERENCTVYIDYENYNFHKMSSDQPKKLLLRSVIYDILEEGGTLIMLGICRGDYYFRHPIKFL